MKRVLLSLGILALTTPAWAQTVPSLPPQGVAALPPLVTKDSPIKAYPYSGGSGWYAGANTIAGVQQASTSANGLFATSLATGSLNAAGGGLGATVGYTSGGSQFWWALEASGDWMNVGATMNAPGQTTSIGSRWQAEQVAKIGGTLQTNFLSAIAPLGINFPSFTLPLTPSNISVAASPHPYIMAGVKEFGIDGNFNTVGGTTVGIAPLVGVGTISSIIDTTGKPTGMALDLFAEVVFANKGLSLTNVFGTGGPVTNANLQMTNQYWTGAKVLF